MVTERVLFDPDLDTCDEADSYHPLSAYSAGDVVRGRDDSCACTDIHENDCLGTTPGRDGSIWALIKRCESAYGDPLGNPAIRKKLNGLSFWNLDSQPLTFVGSFFYAGNDESVHSSNIEDGQTASIFSSSVTLEEASTVYWDMAVSSESGWDYLKFYVDGSLRVQASGVPSPNAWNFAQWQTPVSAGTHVFKWAYEKDGSVSHGFDGGRARDVYIVPNGWTCDGSRYMDDECDWGLSGILCTGCRHRKKGKPCPDEHTLYLM